mmetsp:Transcript_34957/g.88035  ORF Transcript_34957/g.88035 Transcript_34957/m.88035 type:complete len:170 (-) Transcript_34957:8-517(-)
MTVKEHLDESSFLVRLTDLYEKNKDAGTVYLQMKRYVGRLAAIRRRRPARQAEAAKGEEPRCLVRARSNQKKSKISTVIYAKDMARFQLALGNIIRLHMDGLKRREKTKEERQQERAERKKARTGSAASKAVKKDTPGAEKAGAEGAGEKAAAEAPSPQKEAGKKKKGK